MPYMLVKNKNETYKLVGIKDKKIYAYETTKAKAKKQISAIEINKQKNEKKKTKEIKKAKRTTKK